MKKITGILLCLMLVFLASASIFAADAAPQIIWQPQNPSYNPYAVATYSVTVQGENLSCTWHLVYDGVDYNISLFDDNYEPWEWYAGEQYGVFSEEFEGYTTFYYYFQGIGEELSGAAIYAVIDNGSGSVTSDFALITVVDGVTTPPTTAVPASVELCQGEEFTLHCEASAADGAPLSYLWYSTSTGKLQNIIAVNRGSEDKADLLVDTTTLGTVYYCCMVTSASGGSTYTSMIPVTVVEPKTQQMVDSAILPEGTVGEKYSFDLKMLSEASNYEVYESSTFPNQFEETGLVIGDDNTISGTPTAAGEYKFVLIGEKSSGAGYYVCELMFKVTAPETEAPTEKETEKPTEAPTESPNEKATEKPVENAPEETETDALENDDNSQSDESSKVELDTLHVVLIAGCALLVGCLGALIFKKR